MSSHGAVRSSSVAERARRYANGAARPSMRQQSAATASRSEAPKTEQAGQRVEHIPAGSIHVGLNPREHFDPERIKELVDSIREHGLLQPISVRPHEGGYQLIAGERRYRAMQSLGMKTVPAIVHHVSEAKARELALIENINRVDMKPTETAKAYRALSERGLSLKQIAERTGKSEANIQQHLALLSLAPHLQKAVDDERLHSSVVRDLAKLSSRGQEEAAERIISQDMGVRSARMAIRAIAAREAQTEMFPTVRSASKAESSARDRYEQTIQRVTDALHSLDDETIASYARILDTPLKEVQRLRLMASQLRRMQDAIEYEAHRRGASTAVSGSAAPRRVRKSA